MRCARGDEGYSLSEMMVVVSLIGIVISAAYMFLNAVNVSQASSSREAALSRAVTRPLLTMEKLFVQNSAIDPLSSPSPYHVTILTDTNGDDVLEQHTFDAVRDPHTGDGYVDLTTYLTDASGARVGAARQSGHIAADNANIRDSVKLFRYYDEDGVEITDMGAVSPRARSIVLQMRVTVDGRSETHVEAVAFRNR